MCHQLDAFPLTVEGDGGLPVSLGLCAGHHRLLLPERGSPRYQQLRASAMKRSPRSGAIEELAFRMR